jgi:hypothetical protein
MTFLYIIKWVKIPSPATVPLMSVYLDSYYTVFLCPTVYPAIFTVDVLCFLESHYFLWCPAYQQSYTDVALKVPKCEIFHLFDFNDFYGIKSL